MMGSEPERIDLERSRCEKTVSCKCIYLFYFSFKLNESVVVSLLSISFSNICAKLFVSDTG